MPTAREAFPPCADVVTAYPAGMAVIRSLCQAASYKRTKNDGADDGIPIRINLKPLLRLALLGITGGSGVRQMA